MAPIPGAGPGVGPGPGPRAGTGTNAGPGGACELARGSAMRLKDGP